jgi:hypothetical protein
MFDPTSAAALKAYTAGGKLVPNNGATPGTIGYVQNNYLVSSGTNVNPNTKISVKSDHNFNSKHPMSGYYGYNRQSVEPGPNGPPTLPGNYSNYNDTTQASDVYRWSWDWTLTPTKLNHFYAGGNNWCQNHDPIKPPSGAASTGRTKSAWAMFRTAAKTS